MNRFQTREFTFKSIFEWELKARPLNWVPDFSWAESPLDFTEAAVQVNSIIEQCSKLDKIISAELKDREIDRLGKVELSLLRLGIWSLQNLKNLDPPIVIGECVKLCKEYGSKDSFRFLNAMLDSIHKKGNLG